jgi:hypothetical protein
MKGEIYNLVVRQRNNEIQNNEAHIAFKQDSG